MSCSWIRLVAIIDAVEDFADGNRRRRVLPDRAESLLELGRDRVFHPEEMIRLEALPEPRGLDRPQPVMDVVEQLNSGAELAPEPLEEDRRELEIRFGAPGALRRQPAALGRLVLAAGLGDAVARAPGPGPRTAREWLDTRPWRGRPPPSPSPRASRRWRGRRRARPRATRRRTTGRRACSRPCRRCPRAPCRRRRWPSSSRRPCASRRLYRGSARCPRCAARRGR